jgi:hypothetical protein
MQKHHVSLYDTFSVETILASPAQYGRVLSREEADVAFVAM